MTIPARRYLSLILTVFLVGCNPAEGNHPWLSELDAGAEVIHSGARLVALPEGLHALEQTTDATEMLIAVHGYDSRGYEWVYPLKTLDTPSISTWFFRWNYQRCPQPAAKQLREAIRAVLGPQIQTIHLIGHSYGGVLLADVLADWSMDVPLQIHIIASPLAGMSSSNKCAYAPPASIARNISVFEWRTRHKLDGAFKGLAVDPQVIALPGSTVTRLPEEYNGNRLGHNRSLSWVADRIVDAR